MGVKDLLQYAPTKDPQVYSSGPIDWWNQVGPRSMQIGETTDIGGKRYSNMNKNFNTDTMEELQNRFSDTTKETPDSTDPYFYKLKNKDTGEIKFGLAPLGLDERYAGQDISNWDVVYNKRRSDAVDLEAQIHGNENFLKRRVVDYGLSKNKFGKGATEIYAEALTGAVANLDIEQTSVLDKVLDTVKKAGEGMQIASGYKDKLGNDSPEGRSERMIQNLSDMPKDFGRGAGIGVAKAVGGIADLLGNEYLKKQMQSVATTANTGISSKNNVSATFGEIAPELALPVVGRISKGAGLARRIAEGASQGALINAGYEMLKEQSGIKEGEEASPLLAGGIGAIIGGFVGGTTGKQLAKAFETGDDSVKAQIVETLTPEQYSHLQQYVKTQQTKPILKQDEPNQTIKADLEKPRLQEVKPEQVSSRVSKSGKKVTDAEGMEKLSKVEYDVVKSTEEAGSTTTKRPLRKDYKTEDRQARAYTEEGSLLSPQGDISQKTSLKIREQEPITDATKHVQDKLKVFDDEQAVKKSYNQSQARLKDENIKETSSAQVKANRLQYEKNLYKDIIKTETGEVKKQARIKLNELNKKKVVEQIKDKEAIAKAEAKIEEQVGKTEEPIGVKTDRQAEQSKIYEHFKANDKDYKEGFGFAKKIIPDKEIYTNILNDAIARKSEVSKAKSRIEKRKSLGNKPNPNDEYIVKHQAELRSDIESFKNKEIDIDELRFRESKRLEDRLGKEEETKFTDKESITKSEENRIEQYRKLGIKKDIRELKPIEQKKSKGESQYKYNQETDSPRIFTESVAKKYKEKNRVGRTKQGDATLREDQIKLLDEGVTPEQLGRLASSDKTVKEIAKEEIARVINKDRRNALGISKHADIKKQYIFKDEMTDASNSAYQFISVLTGDKSLAQGTKLTASGKDFRTEIANEMKLRPDLQKKIETNTNEAFGKSHIKPLSMVWAYGSTDKSLIKTFAKDNKLTLNEAEEVFREFNKVFVNKYPSAKMLRDNIYNLQERNKGTFTWTLPNGTKSSYTAKGSEKGRLGKTEVGITTESSDMSSRALMPNIIHSIDGYAIQEVAKRLNIPIATVHDAVRTTKGKSDEVLKVYTEIMQEINDSNLLDDIMRELGYKGKPLKRHFGQLTKEDISGGTEKMSVEHSEGERIDVAKKEIDDSRIKEPNELMRDYMAGQDVRKVEANQMLDTMVNEQMYSDIITKPSNSPFENVMYHAMRGNKFTERMTSNVPKGVDEVMYKAVEKELFEEARMKLEYNPLLRNEVKGMRKYFDENGKQLGRNVQTVNEILRAERKLAESKGIKNYETIAKEVRSFKPDTVLTKAQIQKKQMVEQIVMDTQKRSLASGYKTLWNEQTSSKAGYTEYNSLEKMKKVFKAEVDRNAELTFTKISKMSPETKANISKLVNSDYEPIKGMTEQQAKDLWNNQSEILKVAGREIEAGAKGLSSEANQFGYHLNNSHLIAERYNLTKSDEKIIDQLISIKAMNDNGGWKALEDLGKDNADVHFVIDTMAQKRIKSEDLFHNNPEKIVKGWKPEVYRGKKELAPDGKTVQYNASSVYDEGVIGSDLQQKKIGTVYEGNVPTFTDLKSELDWMHNNRLRKTNGQYRKVADEKIRTELGKVNDLEEIITEAVRSTDSKIKQQGLVMKVLVDVGSENSLLFSKQAKEGYTALTKEQSYKLPFDLREDVKYINTEFITKLIGREEVRIYKGDKQTLKILDRLASNLGTAFKQNVVLKNPASYLNSILVNQTLGMTIGANPLKHAVYQRRAMKDLKEMNALIDVLHEQKVTGKELDKALSDKLGNNELYKMERAGLSTNRVEGVVGDDDLMGAMLKDKVHSGLFKLFQHLNLNQKTPLGKKALRTFSDIDTMGRYSIVKSLMDKNPKMTLDEAVKQSNGLFGDMDKMVPPMIELLDKYGFAPFLKWFTLTSPTLLKISKENPVKALAVAVGLYVLGQETGRNFSSVNPLEAVIDFSEMSTPIATVDKVSQMGLWDTISSRAESNVIPKYIHNAWKSPTTLGAEKLLKKRIEYEPYKGFVQSTIEKKGEE